MTSRAVTPKTRKRRKARTWVRHVIVDLQTGELGRVLAFTRAAAQLQVIDRQMEYGGHKSLVVARVRITELPTPKRGRTA